MAPVKWRQEERKEEKKGWATPSDAGWLIEFVRQDQAGVKVVLQPCCPGGEEIGF